MKSELLLCLLCCLVPLESHALKPGNQPAGEGTIALGTGAGYHSPDSPFAPLQDRADVLPWSVLTSTKAKAVRNKMVPVFKAEVLALDNKGLRIQGFMVPLDPGEKQKHFLLSAVPVTCPFCVPGGPESMVEVKTRTPVKYSFNVIVVEGQFTVLRDDPLGLYYRITDAAEVK